MSIVLVNRQADFSDNAVGFIPSIGVPDAPEGLELFSVLRKNEGFATLNFVNGDDDLSELISNGELAYENSYVKSTNSRAGFVTSEAPADHSQGYTYFVLCRAGLHVPTTTAEFLTATNYQATASQGVQLSRSGTTGLFNFRIGNTDILNLTGSDVYAGDDLVLIACGYNPNSDQIFIAGPHSDYALETRSAPSNLVDSADIYLLRNDQVSALTRYHGAGCFAYFDRPLTGSEISEFAGSVKDYFAGFGVSIL